MEKGGWKNFILINVKKEITYLMAIKYFLFLTVGNKINFSLTIFKYNMYIYQKYF